MNIVRSVALWAERYTEKYKQQGMQQGLQTGLREGLQAGLRKGRHDGKALVLEKLLVQRFGALPADVVARLEAASADRLDAWVDRVLVADTLDAVFQR